METECELCGELFTKTDNDPLDICPECWQAQRNLWAATPYTLEEVRNLGAIDAACELLYVAQQEAQP